MSAPANLTPERDQLAAEYALGVLDGRERAEARRAVAGDSAFRAAVAAWSGRLAPMLDEVEPVEAPDGLWPAIEARIGSPVVVAAGNVVQLRRRVTVWRGVSAGMTALAASLAMVLLLRPQPAALPAPSAQIAAAPMVALIGDDRKNMKLVANWDPDGRRLVLAVAGDMPSDTGKAHELWIIPANGQPRSLGTMPDQKRMHMNLADALSALMRSGATIAISVEPAGGSPTGRPTGPVIASGTLQDA